MTPARILFVCTANRCRSVLAEALAARTMADLPVAVASAGLLPGGEPVPPNGIAVGRELGLDLSAHRSRTVDRNSLGRWDAVLTMTRAHSRELVAADPALWPRVFTLPQFARWIEEHPPDGSTALGPWIDDHGSDRPRSELLGASAADDVDDPVDGPRRAWRRLATRLDSDLSRVAARLRA